MPFHLPQTQHTNHPLSKCSDGLGPLAPRYQLLGTITLYVLPSDSGYAFNPNRGRQVSELEASLVYRVSSRTARATQRNPVSKNQNLIHFKKMWGWGFSSVVERLPRKRKALGSVPSSEKKNKKKKKKKKRKGKGWRDGSVVKSSVCYSRGPEFSSQQPHGGSQPSVMGFLFWCVWFEYSYSVLIYIK